MKANLCLRYWKESSSSTWYASTCSAPQKMSDPSCNRAEMNKKKNISVAENMNTNSPFGNTGKKNFAVLIPEKACLQAPWGLGYRTYSWRLAGVSPKQLHDGHAEDSGRGSALNPFRTAVPFWGQTTRISSSFSPKRDCCSKVVARNNNTGYYFTNMYVPAEYTNRWSLFLHILPRFYRLIYTYLYGIRQTTI